ncbi:MAG: NADP-dependent oxidoreductase [Patescibacteria group bacterium]
MKAAQINEYGDPSVVVINEVEKPAASEGQVLVEVYASSLNPFDSSVRAGDVRQYIPLDLPVTLGGDIAGVVVEVSDGVTHVSVGDKVYGQASAVVGNSGAFAEYAITRSTQVAKMPSNLDFIDAASLVLVGVSAIQGVTEHINLRSGQKILIHGGGGAIGGIAIQIAKHLNAYVATTATGVDLDYVKKLGADEVVDYKERDFSAILKDFDAVFDTVGGEDFSRSFGILKGGALAVSMAADPDEAKATELGITALHQNSRVTIERLDALGKLIEEGIIKPRVGKVFPLEQTNEAFEARDSGAVPGKIVLEIKKA